MRRALALCLCASAAGCGARRPPVTAPALFPVTALWTAKLSEMPEGLLAVDDHRVLVSLRGGSVQALDRTSGAPVWTFEGGGPLGSGAQAIVTRTAGGTLVRLRPRSGEVVWRTETGVAGSVPPVVDGDLVFVAGQGLAAVRTEGGTVLWKAKDGGIASTVPVATPGQVLVGETDGTLRCRDRLLGEGIWTRRLRSALVAPPHVDARRRIFVGTTDRQVMSLRLDDGKPGWRWRVGADVQSAPVTFGDKVIVAALDAVLYALKRGNGHLAWRVSLPSRPVGPPLVVGGAVLVACAENDILGFDGKTGARLGTLKTAAEIRTPVVVNEGQLYVGLRDRSVVAYSLASAAAAKP